jgi:DNA-binding MarR family transcriptional regulator
MKKSKVSHLHDHQGYWLRCLSNAVHQSFELKLAQLEVTVAQWVVMRMLYDKKNISLTQLVKHLGVDKSSLSRMLERLVQKKLITRDTDIDRRSIRVNLTRKGRRLVPEMAKLADENDQEFFKSLSNTKRKEFQEICLKLLREKGWEMNEQISLGLK